MGKNNKADKGHDVKKAEMAAAARAKKDHRSPDQKSGQDALARVRQMEIDAAKAAKKAMDQAYKASCEELQSFIDEKGALTVEDAPLLMEALREHLDFVPGDVREENSLSEQARFVLRPLVARLQARQIGLRAKQDAATKADLVRKMAASEERADRARKGQVIEARADIAAMRQLDEALSSLGVASLMEV